MRFKKLFATVLSSVMLMSMAVNSYAADYTEDGSATIPINAEVTVRGSYTLTLPATVSEITKLSFPDNPVIDGRVQVNVPVSIAWDNMQGKALGIYKEHFEISNGTNTYTTQMQQNPDDSALLPTVAFFADPATSFNEDNVSISGTYIYDDTNNGFFEDTVRTGESCHTLNLNTETSLNSTVYDPTSLIDEYSGIYVNLKYQDMPVGTYTGNISLTWKTYSIDSSYLN